jgi:hypothetical protein
MSLRHRLGLDADPMRRPVDRLESGVLVALLVVFAFAGPATGILTARLTYADAAPQAAQERATRVRATATVLEDARSRAADSQNMWPANLVRVKARWTAADGAEHRGSVTVGPETTAGTQVRVWIDDRGELTIRPRSVGQVLAFAGWSGAIGVCLLGLVFLGAGRLARFGFDRRRLELWEREWRDLAGHHGHPV